MYFTGIISVPKVPMRLQIIGFEFYSSLSEIIVFKEYEFSLRLSLISLNVKQLKHAYVMGNIHLPEIERACPYRFMAERYSCMVREKCNKVNVEGKHGKLQTKWGRSRVYQHQKVMMDLLRGGMGRILHEQTTIMQETETRLDQKETQFTTKNDDGCRGGIRNKRQVDMSRN